MVNHEVFLITSQTESHRSGCIATWVMPASLQQGVPRFCFLSSPLNYTHQLIMESKQFGIQLLASDQYPLLADFGLGSGRDSDKFANQTMMSESPVPLVAHTCAWAVAHLEHSFDFGERVAIIGRVIDQQTEQGKQPLTKNDGFDRLDDEKTALLAKKHKTLAIQSEENWPLSH